MSCVLQHLFTKSTIYFTQFYVMCCYIQKIPTKNNKY